MTLKELQASLVEHQKQRDDLAKRVSEIITEVRVLQEEHQKSMNQGQLLEGGIMLLDTLIEQAKDDG